MRRCTEMPSKRGLVPKPKVLIEAEVEAEQRSTRAAWDILRTMPLPARFRALVWLRACAEQEAEDTGAIGVRF